MRNPTSFLGEEYRRAHRERPRLEAPRAGRAEHAVVHDRREEGPDVLLEQLPRPLEPPRLKKAAIEAVRTHGAGSGSVRAIAGNMDLHVQLEERLARFKRAEASLVYQTGYAANSGPHPTARRGRRPGRERRAQPRQHHRRRPALASREGRLPATVTSPTSPGCSARRRRHSPSFGRILVITDGVFSMDGDIAPLDKIAAAAAEHGAMVYVDDAHGEGVLGEGGRGIVSHFHLRQGPGPGRDGNVLQGVRRGRRARLGLARPCPTSPTTSPGPGS